MTPTYYKEKLEAVLELSYDAEIDVVEYGDHFEVTVSKSYDYVAVTPAMLVQFEKVFGTDCIDFRDAGYSEGCESCDYGSSYSVVFTVYK